MYQFNEHCMPIGTTSRWDKQVYLLPSSVSMTLLRGASHTTVFVICLYSSHLQLPNYVTYSA